MNVRVFRGFVGFMSFGSSICDVFYYYKVRIKRNLTMIKLFLKCFYIINSAKKRKHLNYFLVHLFYHLSTRKMLIKFDELNYWWPTDLIYLTLTNKMQEEIVCGYPFSTRTSFNCIFLI